MGGIAAGSSWQITLSTLVASEDACQDFILDYVKLCTLVKRLRRSGYFEEVLCTGWTLPKIDRLHSTYVPRLFVDHLTALKDILRGQLVSIAVEETTDVRDHSILNVITTLRGQPYLISVVKMDACNHSTISQAIIQSITDVGIAFHEFIAAVADSAATARKRTNRE